MVGLSFYWCKGTAFLSLLQIFCGFLLPFSIFSHISFGFFNISP